jgi:hypothetical protein
MRVVQPGSRFDLALEALCTKDRTQLGVKNLECYRTVMPQVMGEIDRGHAPTSKLALDVVAIG